MTKSLTRVRRACLAATGAATLQCGSLHAQPVVDAPSTEQRVVVTGSAIGRVRGESPDPVQIITAEDMRRSGRTSLQEVLQSLTANGQGSLSQSFPGSSAAGAAGVSLRGLTVGETLVLIDGYRMAPFPIGDDGQRAFVDIANLPFDAVDRIEVLKDGASATYGSDAIAGVVNIILKRSFTGARLTGDAGTSQRGGGALRHVAALFGRGNLAADGHNLYVAAEFRAQDAIRFDQRGSLFTQTDYRSTGGENLTPGAHNPSVGDHPYSGTGYVTSSDGTIAGFMRGCDAASFAADQCTYRDTWHEILPSTRHADLTGRFTQTLGADWQLGVDASWFDSRSDQTLQPARTFTDGYQGLVFGPGQLPLLLPALPPTSIASTNPSFPVGTGLNAGNLYDTFLDLGPQVTRTDARTTRLNAELQGRAGDWELVAALGGSQVTLRQVSSNVVNAANLQTALDSVTNPYLVGGPNTPEVDAFVAPRLSAFSTSRLAFAHLQASRDMATLPGGAWRIAVGADQGVRTQHAVSAAAYADGSVAGGNAYAIGTQDSASIHAETRLPLTHAFELDAALRYDHYNISGGRASPKLGLRFAPWEVVSFHGTASRGFRAPGPAENGNAGQAYTDGTVNDPLLCKDGNPSTVGNFPAECSVAVSGVQATNRALRAETSTNYTLGLTLQAVRDLTARLDFFSVKVDHQIVVGPGVFVRGSNLAPLDQVQADGTTTLVSPPVAPIAYLATPYINANSTKVSGVDLELKAHRRVAGLGDFSSGLTLTYIGRYDTTIDGVTYRLAGTHGPSTVSGDTGNPRTRVQWASTFATDTWDVTTTLGYVGGYGVTDPAAVVTYGTPEDTCAQALASQGGRAGNAYKTALAEGNVPNAGLCRVKAFTSVDLAARIAVTKRFSLHGSVNNLFDSGPPHDWATYNGAGAPYNPALHLSGAIGRFLTVGATYEF